MLTPLPPQVTGCWVYAAQARAQPFAAAPRAAAGPMLLHRVPEAGPEWKEIFV